MIGITNGINKKSSDFETINVTLNTNQQNHADIVGVNFTLTYGNYTQTFAWKGSPLTIEVPAFVEYTLSFEGVEGYLKPADASYTAQAENSRSVTFTYKTELVQVTVGSDNGASVSGAKVNINGKQQTWNGNVLTQKVPFGTSYTVSVGEMSGFSTPASKSFKAEQAVRELSFTYIASALKVNILSNQSTESSWDPTITNIKATVKYGSTTLQVSSGQQINIPTDQEVTITFPSVTGYKTPDTIKFTNTNGGVVEKTGTYQTQLLTVNVTYSGTAPSGYTITGKDSGGNVLFTQAVAFATHKIPYGTSYTISASKLDGYDAVANQSGVANSTSNTITMMYVHNPAKDLSKFDIYGNAISQTTANCYVVSKADTYRLPLVFGNAIKNGATNSAAYTKNSGNYSRDFVDYNGTKMTSPYIETVSGTAASAQLSIADADGIFTDISIIDGSPCRYLRFKVNSVPINGANGIISIKNSSGVIMWSWHIWVWPHDLSPVEITNASGVKYNILPVNLASKMQMVGSAPYYITNWHYQWGRPTPFICPEKYNSNTNHNSYGVLSLTKNTIAPNLQAGIQNPTTFYKASSSYGNNWFKADYSKSSNLWDADYVSSGASDNNVKKTIYDPCPTGFKVPNGNIFTGFTLISVDEDTVRFTRYNGDSTGIEFSTSGFRYGETGDLAGCGSNIHVWTSAGFGSYNQVYFLYFAGTTLGVSQVDYKAHGFSVRPVQE